MSQSTQEPLVFSCAGDRLVGVLHRPRTPHAVGVVIVTGAPQYRIGSHRQFVLLARRLADAGFTVLRFDYRGMGDSEGAFSGFEGVDDDIKAAIDTLFAEVDAVETVALWGLCDGASAATFYAPQDRRVGGLVLVNPWVRSATTSARAQVKHYYGARLLSLDFWRRVVHGQVGWRRTIGDLLRVMRNMVALGSTGEPGSDLPARVADSLHHFAGPVLLILSGADLTAQEFDAAVLRSAATKSWLAQARVELCCLADANHTYSRRAWREQVHGWTESWLRQLARPY